MYLKILSFVALALLAGCSDVTLTQPVEPAPSVQLELPGVCKTDPTVTYGAGQFVGHWCNELRPNYFVVAEIVSRQPYSVDLENRFIAFVTCAHKTDENQSLACYSKFSDPTPADGTTSATRHKSFEFVGKLCTLATTPNGALQYHCKN